MNGVHEARLDHSRQLLCHRLACEVEVFSIPRVDIYHENQRATVRHEPGEPIFEVALPSVPAAQVEDAEDGHGDLSEHHDQSLLQVGASNGKLLVDCFYRLAR